ncbi:MAG: hypothetical protein OEV37_00285 [Candidatus Berkelbacteria bacterium]|nr:hypothetical protein [Candidatus Berkelbacteria bacterium]
MAITKTCKVCSAKFEITDTDLAFYKKISPVFGGKTFDIPPPNLCPHCREQNRLAFRNEQKLYKRKCNSCQKDIISIYSPDKEYNVYCYDCWWSDKWDATDYGQDYNPTRPFLEQVNEILKKVPRMAAVQVENENSEYGNYFGNSKNSYMCFASRYCENCYYCNWAYRAKDCVDSLFVIDCEYLYGCLDCRKSNRSKFLINCVNTSECYFSENLIGCNNCFGCKNLRNKSYCILNEQKTKEEFEKFVKEFKDWNLGKLLEIRQKMIALPVKPTEQHNCENSLGDKIKFCKNCKYVFSLEDAENAKYVFDDIKVRDSQDINISATNELTYQSVCGEEHYNSAFIVSCLDIKNVYYSFECLNSVSNCFGCIDLRNHKEYCILNKQYTKEGYEKLVPQIIEKMIERGEWGEFFPISMSPFGYNETVAMNYYPLEKDEAKKLGSKWQDNDYDIKYDGPFYEPKDIKNYVENEEEREKLLKGILKCETTGKPFKIMPQELAFYMANSIPIPKKHWEERFKGLFSLRNPRKLWHRQCMCEETDHDHSGPCKNEFETTYAPDRTEKVYCETCYQKSVI